MSHVLSLFHSAITRHLVTTSERIRRPLSLLRVFTFNRLVNGSSISPQDGINDFRLVLGRRVRLVDSAPYSKTHLGSAGLFWARCFLSDLRSQRKTHSQTPGPCQSHPLGQFNLPANGAESPSAWRLAGTQTQSRCGMELLRNSLCATGSQLYRLSVFLWVRKGNQCWLCAHRFELYLSVLFSREPRHFLFSV